VSFRGHARDDQRIERTNPRGPREERALGRGRSPPRRASSIWLRGAASPLADPLGAFGPPWSLRSVAGGVCLVSRRRLGRSGRTPAGRPPCDRAYAQPRVGPASLCAPGVAARVWKFTSAFISISHPPLGTGFCLAPSVPRAAVFEVPGYRCGLGAMVACPCAHQGCTGGSATSWLRFVAVAPIRVARLGSCGSAHPRLR